MIDFSNFVDKKLRDDLVAPVDVMLTLHQRKSPLSKRGARGDFEGDQLQRQIDKTDREVNVLVHKLYGITDAERAIVEENQRVT
ncbi:hypothetical protein [Candidatus Methylomirabilis sp.]|uniref:hypothetical protein n=1 Tax=Candidatus Methylomirabilis sp. TaxID=2032687 RepID=UPI003076258D